MHSVDVANAEPPKQCTDLPEQKMTHLPVSIFLSFSHLHLSLPSSYTFHSSLIHHLLISSHTTAFCLLIQLLSNSFIHLLILILITHTNTCDLTYSLEDAVYAIEGKCYHT